MRAIAAEGDYTSARARESSCPRQNLRRKCHSNQV